MKAIIIDDEKLIRRALKELLHTYCTDVLVVGESDGVENGFDLIAQTDFDILFLDIKMKDGTGFDLLAKLHSKSRNFQLIFTTAYDEFALKAIKQSAIDYLLKPIDPDELQKAVMKAKEKQEPNMLAYEELLQNVFKQNPDQSKLSLATAERIYLVNIQDIIRCESTNNYTYFYLKNKSRLLITKTLKDYEELLGQQGFLRIHRSHLVNTAEIVSFEKQKGSYIILRDGTELPVSQRKKEDLMRFFRSTMP
jgi:two-component system, LytTR family, response regulator